MVVLNSRPSAVVTVAMRASLARTDNRSVISGAGSRRHVRPSVVRRTTPPRPTIQHTVVDTAAPAVSARVHPGAGRFPSWPLRRLDRSTSLPARRQRIIRIGRENFERRRCEVRAQHSPSAHHRGRPRLHRCRQHARLLLRCRRRRRILRLQSSGKENLPPGPVRVAAGAGGAAGTGATSRDAAAGGVATDGATADSAVSGVAEGIDAVCCILSNAGAGVAGSVRVSFLSRAGDAGCRRCDSATACPAAGISGAMAGACGCAPPLPPCPAGCSTDCPGINT